ncbi:MAG: ribbon-helix-helix protein, CopG family [Desulfovibrio sp.]|nr:ribbon-helix-helix protein, CopG family [Desulfovibrio sp.]
MKNQIHASIKLSNDLHAQLVKLAELRQRSVHSLMLQALETYVTRELKREAWREEGMAAWEEYQRTGLHLTNDEVLDWLSRTADGENVEMPECHL